MADVSLSRETIKAISKSELIMESFDGYWNYYEENGWEERDLGELLRVVKTLTTYKVKLSLVIDEIEETLHSFYYDMNDISTWEWELTECQQNVMNFIITAVNDIEYYIQTHYKYEYFIAPPLHEDPEEEEDK